MRTLTGMPARAYADRRWRAALIVLCGAFADDETVWAHVEPGDWSRLGSLLAGPACRYTRQQKALLAFCSEILEPASPHRCTLGDLSDMGDAGLRLVFDALAVLRGRELPVDWPERGYRRPIARATG